MQVYVRLLDEGVDVWRPVDAVEEDGAYRLVGPAHAPKDEHWEFEIGERVRCEVRTFAGARCGRVREPDCLTRKCS
jgi:hypothetical protein